MVGAASRIPGPCSCQPGTRRADVPSAPSSDGCRRLARIRRLARRLRHGTILVAPTLPRSECLLDPNAIREGFNQAAGCYDAHAALEQEVCARLLERCSYQRRPPRRILDLGCGTGEGSRELKRRFRRAQVMGLDSSPAMLAQLRRRSSLLKPLQPVCGDMSRLPFAARSMDLLFSSMANHWSPDPASLYDEYRRVLRPEGMLLFATLGPGTLAELFEAWAAVGGAPALAPFPDLMVIGDALMAAGFGEPVMDTERITVRYRSLDALVQELECTLSLIHI